MAIVKGTGQQTTAIQRLSEGADVYLRALRDGTMIAADWKQAAIMGGFGFHVNVGTFSTGVTGGGNGSIIDQDQPELLISIPNGTALIPLRFAVDIIPGAVVASGDESEILIAVDQDKVDDASGTSSLESVYNLNTLCGKTSACIVSSAFTTSTNNPALDIELAHAVITADTEGTPAAFVWNQLSLLYEPEVPPIINGPAMLIVYYGGTVATSGFIAASWLEFPENAFTI